jgi:hypothetical protein
MVSARKAAIYLIRKTPKQMIRSMRKVRRTIPAVRNTRSIAVKSASPKWWVP